MATRKSQTADSDDDTQQLEAEAKDAAEKGAETAKKAADTGADTAKKAADTGATVFVAGIAGRALSALRGARRPRSPGTALQVSWQEGCVTA
jgi:hypothetical protein